jgi:hypothetical protein
MADKSTTKKDVKDANVVNVETGDITYEDHGDYILEIDNRGPDEVRRQIPKALAEVPVDQATHDQLTERLEIEKAAAENEGRDPESVTWTVPPLKEDKPADAEPETVTVTASGEEK